MPQRKLGFFIVKMLTFTDLQTLFLQNTNQVGTTDTNVLGYFGTSLGTRYQLALAKLQNYKTETYETTFLTGMNVTLLSSGVTQTISSITSSSTTATVTTAAAHGYSTSNSVEISGANPTGYNGTFTITVTSTTTFTYTLPASVSNVAASCSQYIPFPPGEITVEGMYITIGSVNYPLRIINSLMDWEQLNAILIQASALPQFYFPRRDDFGIWPIPQSSYTGKITYRYRDRNLSVADYTTGTVTVTQYGTTITGSSTTFTPAMVGRWFMVTSTTAAGQGVPYRITAYTDSTHLTIAPAWNTTTASGLAFRIGEAPAIPEELHVALSDGATADFYAGMRKDLTTAALFENRFWTGDANNPSRKEGDSTIAGGIIGGVNRYASRDNTRVIKRKPRLNPLQTKIFATTLSS